MSGFIANDVISIYKMYFGNNYSVSKGMPQPENISFDKPGQLNKKQTNIYGTPLYGIDEYTGREYFLPVTFKISEKIKLTVSCCTIRITSKKTIIRTPVSERKGTVKEQFNIEDYQYTVKGVLSGRNRDFPDEQIILLKEIYESSKPVELLNPLTELFTDKSNKIIIENLEFPDTQGKTIRHKPFILTCETDFIDSLIVE